MIERAEPVVIRDGIRIPLPSTADLILLKLAAGGPLDYVDAYNLMKLGPQNDLVAEISSKIGDLPEDAQKLWQRLLAEITPPSP